MLHSYQYNVKKSILLHSQQSVYDMHLPVLVLSASFLAQNQNPIDSESKADFFR